MNCKETERLALWTGLGLGIGAGLMYLLDPDHGRRRRALLRDKTVSTAHKIDDSFGRTLRDLDHRARGLAAEARAAILEEGKTRVHGSKVTRESLKLAAGAESRSSMDLLAST